MVQAALGTSAVLMNGSLWVSKKRCNRPTQSTSRAITRIHMDGLTCDLYNKMKIFKYHQEVGRETAGQWLSPSTPQGARKNKIRSLRKKWGRL